MQETIEIRIPERKAKLVLPQNVGRVVGREFQVRILKLPVNDPLVGELAMIDQARTSEGGALITSWDIQRKYTPTEIQRAEIFSVRSKNVVDCAGEQFGTAYDTSQACVFCGFRRVRTSQLRLGCHCRPRPDLSTTLAADEILVSERMASSLRTRRRSGVELESIEWRGECPDLDVWKQLNVVSPPVSVDRSRTRFGETPLDSPATKQTACPLGHVAGLNLLSELHCNRASYDGADVMETDVAVGSTSGFLVPAPILVVSGDYGRHLIASKMRGVSLEVAYLD